MRCPPDCAYRRVAEERLRERRARELEQAWALWYRELSQAGRERIWPHIEVVAEALAAILHRVATTDAEVEGALRYLDQALSPLVLVPSSPPPLGRALAEEGLLPLMREGKVDGERLREAVQTLVSWLEGYRSAKDPLRFVRGLLGVLPPRPEEPQGLIVRPPGPA